MQRNCCLSLGLLPGRSDGLNAVLYLWRLRGGLVWSASVMLFYTHPQTGVSEKCTDMHNAGMRIRHGSVSSM